MKKHRIKIDDEAIKISASSESFEEIEKKYQIELPGQPMLKRMGCPKSRYYKLFTKKNIAQNKKKVDAFLKSIH